MPKPDPKLTDQSKPSEVLANRHNLTYTKRYNKLVLNLLALEGGRPYIEARLTRFPSESSIDWSGSGVSTSEKRFSTWTIKSVGRKQRAYLVNTAARIAEKIRQTVFAIPPVREDVDTAMEEDITRQGDSINAFMGDVLRNIVATKWCWIGIDAPVINGEISLAEKEQKKIRPYWRLYQATEVVDWCFDDKGELKWLMTEGIKWDNTDPTKWEEAKTIRRLWEKGKVTEYIIKVGTNNIAGIESENVIPIKGIDKVPFVSAGEISEKPHFYDDVEDLQAATLDLESCLDTLYHKIVFAQPVLPRSAADEITGESDGQDVAQKAAEIIGYAHAILESNEESGIARYIGPEAGGIESMQKELGRKRESLFDTVGLHLGFSKDFSESPDSKQIDNLDPQAVLRNYAQQIKEAEEKAWKMTSEWDSTVKGVNVIYADKFRVTNIYEDFKSLILADNMELPDSLKRLAMRGVADVLSEITNLQLSKKDRELIEKEIKDMDFNIPVLLTADSMAGKTAAGVKKQATDDGVGLTESGAE